MSSVATKEKTLNASERDGCEPHRIGRVGSAPQSLERMRQASIKSCARAEPLNQMYCGGRMHGRGGRHKKKGEQCSAHSRISPPSRNWRRSRSLALLYHRWSRGESAAPAPSALLEVRRSNKPARNTRSAAHSEKKWATVSSGAALTALRPTLHTSANTVEGEDKDQWINHRMHARCTPEEVGQRARLKSSSSRLLIFIRLGRKEEEDGPAEEDTTSSICTV
jgi:hypothetical protein